MKTKSNKFLNSSDPDINSKLIAEPNKDSLSKTTDALINFSSNIFFNMF